VIQIFQNNFSLKLLALGLALVGWAYFRFASNPFAPEQLDQQLSIPIAAVNLPLGYVARFTDHEASVTIVTKRGQPPIKPDEIKAVLDLSNKTPGVYNVPVQLVAPDVAVQSLSPASVALSLERIEQRSFPVTVHYVGGQGSGTVVSDTRVEPNLAVVRAPTSELAQVTAVRADVALPNQAKAIDEMVRPVPVDASGTQLSGLTVTPNLVRVQMHVVAGTGRTQ
jgi:YbbR domain-containing protein